MKERICLQTLAEITGAELRLGDPPPLGGAWEPMGRVVVEAQSVKRGDLFWEMNAVTNDSFQAEQALARGAAGVVVSQRKIAPWPGRFACRVADSYESLCRLAQDVRTRFQGTVVGVQGGAEPDGTARLIHHVLERGGIRSSLCEGSPDCPERAFASLIEHAPSATCIVSWLPTNEPEAARDWWRVFQPGVVASADSPPSDGSAPELALVIVQGDNPARFSAWRSAGYCTVSVGRGAANDRFVSRVQSTATGLELHCRGERALIQGAGRHRVASALAAWEIASHQGLADNAIARAITDFVWPAARFEITQTNGRLVVNNTGGGSLASVRAAMAVMRDLKISGEVILCVNAEWPYNPAPSVVRLGQQLITRCGATRLVVCGEAAVLLQNTAIEAGLPARNVQRCHNWSSVLEFATGVAEAGDAVLLEHHQPLTAEQVALVFSPCRTSVAA